MGECSDDPNGPGRPPLPRKGAIRPRSNNKTSPQDDRSEVTRPRRQSAPIESTLGEKDSDDNAVVRSIPFTANDSHASLPSQTPVKLGTSRSRRKSPRRASEPINWERTNAAPNDPRRAESSSSLRDDSSIHSQSSVSSVREKMQSFKMNADLPPAFKTVRRSSMGDSGHTDLSGNSSTTQGNGLPPLQPTVKRPPRVSKTTSPEKASSFPSLPVPPPPKSNFFVSPVTGTKHIRNQDIEEDSSHSFAGADLESSQASLIQTPPPQNPKSNVKSTSTSPRKRSSTVPNNGKDSTTPQQVQDPLPLRSPSPKNDENLSERQEERQRSSTTPVVASLVSPSSKRFSMSNWKTMANVEMLPPGFRAMVESMRGVAEAQETSPAATLRPPPPLEGRQQDDIRSVLAGGNRRAIAELIRVFSKRNLLANIDTAVDEDTDENPQNQEPPTQNPHGVIMYERPDGFGEAATPTNQMANRSVEEDLDALEDPNDPASYDGLLASIAACKLDDRANRAGKVLKRMKEMKMPVSDITIILLRLCTEIPDRVPEPKPQEVALRSILIEETHYTEGPNGEKTPLLAPTKRVRFADTNELRIIRRRRSIGSNERWDDPLTPPKRISAYVDVSVSRFSTGPRDDRPALPRRTNSMSSLLSGSSHSSDGSFSSSSTELDPPFKLPFGDSPEVASRKSNSDSLKTPVQKFRKGLPKPATRLAGKRPTPPVQDVPTAPTRKASMDMDLSPMAPTDEPPAPGPPPGEPMSPSVPPPPPADFPLETPPPPPRRRVQRRRSISGIERRADTPLTPPRRVSDKSDLYAAQVSLREARAPADPGLQLPLARLRRPSVGSPIESFQKVDKKPKEPRSPSQPEEAAPPLPQRKRSIMTTKAAPESSTPSLENEPVPPPPPMDALEVSLAKARISTERTTSTTRSTQPHPPPPPPPPPMEEPTTRINKVERHREVIAEEWNVVDFGEDDDVDNGEQPPPPPPPP